MNIEKQLRKQGLLGSVLNVSRLRSSNITKYEILNTSTSCVAEGHWKTSRGIWWYPVIYIYAPMISSLLPSVRIQSCVWLSGFYVHCWGFMKNWLVECTNVTYSVQLSITTACIFMSISSHIMYDIMWLLFASWHAWHTCGLL